MTQLILSIVLMYVVVGSAGYWGLRKRRDQQMLDNQSPATSSQKQGAI